MAEFGISLAGQNPGNPEIPVKLGIWLRITPDQPSAKRAGNILQ